jgi:diguanylate cyclase (GGDEF)-like protein/PAS domain S-box-containing protein
MTTALNILIVEDSAADAELVVEHLRGAGFDPNARIVDTERDYLAALTPGLDLILSDYSLPQFNGFRALELMQARGLDIPFILMSGTLGEERAVEAIQLGASDYVLKDRMTRLSVAVERALQHKRERDERRQARAEIARLAAIVESSNDAIVSRSLDGTITSWNAGAARMFGYTAEETVGQSIMLLMPPGAPSRLGRNTETVLAGENVAPFETQRITKDGRILDMLVSVSPIRDAEGRVTGASAIFHDISDRKRAELSLNESEHRFRQITENIREVFWLTNCEKTEMCYISPAYESIWGRSCADLYDNPKSWLDAIHPADRERVVAAAHTQQTSGAYDEEYRIVRPDGSVRWVHDRAFPVTDETGAIYRIAGIAEDITERKQLEREAQQKARLTEMLEALARATNESDTSAQAMQRCLEYICVYGEWPLGCVGTFAAGQSGGTPQTTYWHTTTPGRYAEFQRISDLTDYRATNGRYVGKVLREKCPVWLADLAKVNAQGRIRRAVECGLRSAFAFPVIVAGEVAAFLEFLAEDPREPDELVLGVIDTISSQLARLIERDRAQAVTAWLAAIVENSSDAIVSRSVDRKITSWNTAAAHLFGYKAEEVIGQSVDLIIPPDQRADAMRNRSAVMRGYPLAPRDVVRITKDGRRIDVSLRQSPIKDANGAITGVSIIFRDISERLRAERAAVQRTRLTELLEALARTANEAATPEEAMQRCLEHICDYGNWPLGCAGTFAAGQSGGLPQATYWRASDPVRFTEFMRLSERTDHTSTRGHFVGKALREKRPVWLPDLSQLGAPGRIGRAAQIGLRAAFAFPVIVGGEVAAFLEFFADEPREPDQLMLEAIGTVGAQLARLIERDRALKALEASEHQLRMVSEHLPAKIAYFDAELRCRFANTAYCDFHRVDPQGVIGMTLREISGEDTWRAISPSIDRVKQGKPFTLRREERTESGEIRHIEIQRVPDMSPEGEFRGYYAMLLDVTEQVRAEAAIKTSETRLRTILDSEPECVKVIAPDGTLVEINRAGLSMFGVESIEPIREHGLLEFVVPGYRRQVEEQFADTLRSGEDHALEFEIVALDGTRRWMESHTARLEIPGTGPANLLVVSRDITSRKQAEERANHLASHDPDTDLPNRTLFRGQVELALARAKREEQAIGVLILDLDGFGDINDSLGHEAGDALIKQAAARLQEGLREADTIGRLDGDSFAVLLENVSSMEQAAAVAEKIVGLFAAPFACNGREIFMSVSVGGDVCAPGAGDTDSVLRHAEAARWRVDREGGNGYEIYVPEPEAPRSQHVDIKTRLRRAIEKDELVLHYQPKVSFASGAITGAEALVRWNNPDLGFVSPAQFIPLAEESGLIIPIGEWVLHTACRQARAWHELGYPLEIAVNLSPRQFRHKDLPGLVLAVLRDTELVPGRLELEITEGSMMLHPQRAIEILGELREIGVQLAVDDFGTGYSSLSYLKRFPLHKLKVDQSFVKDLTSDADSQAIVTATVGLAHNLRLRTHAEGVETEAQRDFLAAAGCDEYQGYLFSKPLPADAFEALLDRMK